MPRPACGSVEIVNRKDGLRTFWARVTVDGRRHRVRLGTDRDGWTPARAQVELEEQIKAVQAGTWAPLEEPVVGEEGDPTFRSYASSWLEDRMLDGARARSRTSSGDWKATCYRASAMSACRRLTSRPSPRSRRGC